MESSRREHLREELGLTTQEEQQKIDKSLNAEECRRAKKEAARQKLENETSYRLVKGVSFLMDKCFLDAVVGFFLPAAGDIIASVLTLPFLYVSLFKIKSIPLTLAILYNMMLDLFIVLTPWIGDLLDIAYRSYVKNYRLIVGFVEDDQEIISEVKRSSIKSIIMIAILAVACFLLYQVVKGLIYSFYAMFGCN